MGWIKLINMDIKSNKVDCYFDVSDDLQFIFESEKHFFVEYDRKIEELPQSILIIPFLCTTMQIAWLTDSVVYVPTVDEVFFNSLNNLKSAYQRMYPNCNLAGELKTTLEKNNSSKKRSAAQVFSGGLDAVTTFLRHSEENPILLTEYGFFDLKKIGSEGYPGDKESWKNFQSDIKAITAFAKEYFVDVNFIYSNYGTFINSQNIDKVYKEKMGDNFWHGLHHAMAILGCAAPIAFDEGATNMYIASSFTVGNTNPCASDPSTDNEFKFGNTQVVHDGYELGDLDKAKYIVDYQKKEKKPVPLRVCSWNDHNCCSCEKCVRRMLELNAVGGDPKNFGFEYDIELVDLVSTFLNKEIQFFIPKMIKKWTMIIEYAENNKDEVYDKKVFDFLKGYNFEKEKKIGLYRYYFNNFFKIIVRKIKLVVNR